jgi:uncharacterized membrane protein
VGGSDLSTYTWLKLIHILAAIVAVGTNVTYFVWLRLAGRDPAGRAGILRGIRALDARLANPAYAVLPAAGILMVLDANIGFTTFWVLGAIVLYALVGLLAGVLFAPSLRRQTELAATGADTTAYQAAARRTTIAGLLTMVPVAAILYLMVMKPTP